MKKVFASVLAALCMVAVLTSCGSSSSGSSSKKEEEFYNMVVETQEILDIVAGDIYAYWHDCIYEDQFRQDINYAIDCALADNQKNIDRIETNNEKIKELYGKAKDGKLKEEVKAVMQAYNDYYTLVLDVRGSFNSYSEDKRTYQTQLSKALKNLWLEL